MFTVRAFFFFSLTTSSLPVIRTDLGVVHVHAFLLALFGLALARALVTWTICFGAITVTIFPRSRTTVWRIRPIGLLVG